MYARQNLKFRLPLKWSLVKWSLICSEGMQLSGDSQLLPALKSWVMIFLNIKNKNTGNKNKNVQIKNTWLPIAVGSEGLPVTHGTTRRNGGVVSKHKMTNFKTNSTPKYFMHSSDYYFNLLNGNALTFYFTLSNARWFYSSSGECSQLSGLIKQFAHAPC